MALSSFKFRSSQMELIKKLWFLVTLIEKSQNSGMTLGTFSSLSSNCGQTDGYTGCPDLPELTPRKETHCEKEEEKGCFRVKPIFHQALHNIFFISLYFKFLFLVKKKKQQTNLYFHSFGITDICLDLDIVAEYLSLTERRNGSTLLPMNKFVRMRTYQVNRVS